MNSERLSLKHQALLTPLFKKLQLDLSEYTFSCLYLFRDVHAYEVIFGKNIYIKGKTRDGFSYLMPTVLLNEIDVNELKELLRGVNFLFPIPEIWEDKLDWRVYKKTFKEEDSDYIFNVKKLQQYQGRDLSKKRNLVHQFQSQYPTAELIPLTKERIPDALQVVEQWKNEREFLQPTDYESNIEAVKLFEHLGLEGKIVYIEKRPAAILLGEPLNDRMYVFRFFKGSREYVGIYQFLLQAYALSLGDKYQEINLEADLGIPELHQTKHSYHPERMAIKLRIQSLLFANGSIKS